MECQQQGNKGRVQDKSSKGKGKADDRAGLLGEGLRPCNDERGQNQMEVRGSKTGWKSGPNPGMWTGNEAATKRSLWLL